jgi:hypothetical protein
MEFKVTRRLGGMDRGFAFSQSGAGFSVECLLRASTPKRERDLGKWALVGFRTGLDRQTSDYMHGGAIGSSYELTSLLLRSSVKIPSIHLFVDRSCTLLDL